MRKSKTQWSFSYSFYNIKDFIYTLNTRRGRVPVQQAKGSYLIHTQQNEG